MCDNLLIAKYYALITPMVNKAWAFVDFVCVARYGTIRYDTVFRPTCAQKL